jgi:hypothetical protein
MKISLLAYVMQIGNIGVYSWCEVDFFGSSNNWFVELGGMHFLAFVLLIRIFSDCSCIR